MLRPRATSLFLSALAISVVTHAGLLLLVGIQLHRAALQRLLAESQNTPKLMPVELSLGLEQPHPDATAWLGFDEEKPQLAEPSVIDQAAFDPAPMTNEPAPEPDPQPAPAPAPSQQPSPESESVPPPPPGAQPAEAATPPPPAANLEALDEMLQDLIKNMKQAAREDAAKAQEVAKATKVEAPASQPMQAHREPSPPPQDTTVHRAAVPADKESQPTSVIEVTPDQWQLGKPLAAQGLEIKTRRPVFTVLTMMTAAPGNPLCEIKFDRDGVPKSASIVRGSGDQRVDDAILACLYRWRAEGSKLLSLKGNDTIAVKIHMILSRHSRGDEDDDESAG